VCIHTAVNFVDKLLIHCHERFVHHYDQQHNLYFNLKFNHNHNSHHDIDILELHKYDLDNTHDNFVLNIIHGYSDEH